MKLQILLTNDDGIESYSTTHLATLLREKGHTVYTVVPMENMSGIGGSISLRKTIFYMETEPNTFAVIGTPVDCINLISAKEILDNNKFDLVISGINAGENAGQCIYNSGTVAAAQRAKLEGFNSIAVSYWDKKADEQTMNICNEFLVDLLEQNSYYQDQPADTFENINIPILTGDIKSAQEIEQVDTFVGKGRYHQKFKKLTEGYLTYDNADLLDMESFEEGSDYDALIQGKISISKIKI